MAKRKPRKPYSGALAVPTPKYDGDNKRWKEVVVIPRLRALMDYYGIDQKGDKKWYQLALRLAFDHVPGLEPPLLRGRKVTPKGDVADYHLFRAIAKARLGPKKKSINNAIRQLTISDARFKGKNPGTLRDRYYLLKDGRSKEARRMHAFMDWLRDEEMLERWIEEDMDEETREETRRRREDAERNYERILEGLKEKEREKERRED